MSVRKRNFSHDSRPRENYPSYGTRRRSESRPRSFFFNHDHEFKHYFCEDKLKTGKEFFEIFYGWNSPFSQNYMTPFKVDNMTFNCAQQYYMYRKAVLFENEEIQRQIMNTTDQNEMKRLGKEIPNFERRRWMKDAVEVVQTASKAKFTQNKKLRDQLFATNPRILVEANPYDNIWGIGVAKHESAAWDMRAWQGENLLGFILTELRDELMQLEETGEALMERVRESNACSIRERNSRIRANEGNAGFHETLSERKDLSESKTVDENPGSLNESSVTMNESEINVKESQDVNESQENMNENQENRNESQENRNESQENVNEISGCLDKSQENMNESQENMNESKDVNKSQENMNESQENADERQEGVKEDKIHLNESRGSSNESAVNMNESNENVNESLGSLNRSQENIDGSAEISAKDDGAMKDQEESAMDKNTDIDVDTNIDNSENDNERNVPGCDVKVSTESTTSESKGDTEKERTIQRNTESYISKMKKIKSAKEGRKDKETINKIDIDEKEEIENGSPEKRIEDTKMAFDVREEGEIDHDKSSDKTEACWEEEWKTEDIVEKKDKQEQREEEREPRSRRRHSESRWGKEENQDKGVDISRINASWDMKKPEPWRDRSIGLRSGVEDLREKVNRRRSESVLPRMMPSYSKHNHIYRSCFEPENMIHDANQLELFFGWYSPFSQHHPAVFEIEGKKFSCAEQWYMYNKAVLFHDKEVEEKIMASTDPKEMKIFGRQVRNFDRKIWMEDAIDIVRRGNLAKFSQNPQLKEKLFDTHPRVLVEASPGDSVWGVGLHKSNPAAWDMRFWRGENLLGFTLTQVRDELMGKQTLPGSSAGSRERGRSCVRRSDYPQDLGSRRDKYRSESLPSRLAQPEIRNHDHEYKSYFESQNMVCGYKNFYFFFGKEFPFSNHHPAEFEVDGKMFTSSEQYYMYQKAVTFKDKEIERKILNSRDPREQKRFGKLVKNFDYRKWLTKAVDVTKTGLMAKFSQNPHLKTQLLETHPLMLVEASPGDKIWGIGLSRDDPKAWDMRTWRGENLLGFTLMKVREELRTGEEEQRKGERRRSEKFRRDRVYSMHQHDSDEDSDEDEASRVSHSSRAKQRRRTHHDSPTSELEGKYLKKKYRKTSTSRKEYHEDSDKETKCSRSSSSRNKYTEKEKKDKHRSSCHKKFDSSSDTESICSRGRERSKKKKNMKTKDSMVPLSSSRFDSETSPDRQKTKILKKKGQKRVKEDKFHRSSRHHDSSNSLSDGSVERMENTKNTLSSRSKYESISSSEESSIERLRKTSITSHSTDIDQHTSKFGDKNRNKASRTARRDTSDRSNSSDSCDGYNEKKSKTSTKSEMDKDQKKPRNKEAKTDKEIKGSSPSSDNSRQGKKPKTTSNQEKSKGKTEHFDQRIERTAKHSDKGQAKANTEGKIDQKEEEKVKRETHSSSDSSTTCDEDQENRIKGHVGKLRSKSMSALSTVDSKHQSRKSSGKCKKNDEKRQQNEHNISGQIPEIEKSKKMPKPGKDQKQAKDLTEEVKESKHIATGVNQEGIITEERNGKGKHRKRKARHSSSPDEDCAPKPGTFNSSLAETKKIKRVKYESHQEKISRSQDEDKNEAFSIFKNIPDGETKEPKSSVQVVQHKRNVSNTDEEEIHKTSDANSKLSKPSEANLSKSSSLEEMMHMSSNAESRKQKHQYVTLGKCDVKIIIKEKETFKKKEKEFKSKINRRNYRRSDGHENPEIKNSSAKEDLVNSHESQRSEKSHGGHGKTQSQRRESCERTERKRSRKHEMEERKYMRAENLEEKERRILKSSREERRYSESLDRRSSERRESTSFRENYSVERKEKWSTHIENKITEDTRQRETTKFREKEKDLKEKSRLSSSKDVFESHVEMDTDDEVFVNKTKKGQGHKRKYSSAESADTSMEKPSHKKKKKKKYSEKDFEEIKGYEEKKTKYNKNYEKKDYEDTKPKEEPNKDSRNIMDNSSKKKGHKKILEDESDKEDTSHSKKVSSKKDKKKKKKKHRKKKSHEDSDLEDLNSNLEKKKKKKKKKEKKSKKANEEKSDEADNESSKMDSKMAATKEVNSKMAVKKKGRKSHDSDSSREEKKIFIKINSNIRVTKSGSGEETDWSAKCKFDVTCDSKQ